jgi:hypothetical protein
MMCATMYGKFDEKFMILFDSDFRFFRQIFPFPKCENLLFQTVKISLFKLSKFPFSKLAPFPKKIDKK